MAHSVKCKYCGQTFDRDTEAYVVPSARRYAHATCYLRQKEIRVDIPNLPIVDPTDIVTCAYCKKQLNKKVDQYVQVSNKKYAHAGCAELEAKREKTESEKLDIYIMNLFDWDYVHPRVKKQIKNYIAEYNFSYSGIQKTLEYFYDLKGNSLEKAHGGIGIVPFIYEEAYNYYYSIWKANQNNTNVKIFDFIPRIREIHIPIPKSKIKKPNFFNFLDEEEDFEY